MKNTLLTYSILLAFGLSSASAELVGQFTFNEGTGTTSNEGISNTDFTVPNSWGSSSVAGSTSLDLSSAATADTGITATDLNFSGTGARTFVAWFRTTQTTPGAIFSYSPTQGAGTGNDSRILVLGNGGLRYEISGGSFQIDNLGLNDGQWHQIAFVYGANEGINDVDYFVDGVLTNRDGGGTAMNIAGSGTQAIKFGDMHVEGRFTGDLDQFSIYDEALTQSQISALTVAAIPEPSSYAILAGMLGLGYAMTRRRS